MNIMTILNKLKSTNMLASSEESLALFSECFNKFGISLLMLNNEDEFNKIVDLLVDNKISLQKTNGIYSLRLFAVDYETLKREIEEFKEIDELDFLRVYPEMLSEPKNIKIALSNITNLKNQNVSYKEGKDYNWDLIMKTPEPVQEPEPKHEDSEINSYLKTILDDASLIDKLNNNEENAENYAITLEIQKIENKICEDYLFPIEDGWGIIIDNISVNNFQEVKENLNKLTRLSIPMSAADIMFIALMYNSKLDKESAKAVAAFLGGN